MPLNAPISGLAGRHVASLPAANTLGFLERVFAFWEEGRLFSITRTPGALEGLGLRVESTVPRGSAAGGWMCPGHRPRPEDSPAQIVFSSGTEGRPKAILLSHRNLADVTTRLNAAMGVNDEIREYIGVPVTYSFGLGRARAVAAAGGSFFLPDRFDPLELREMLAAGAVNAVSAVPSLWRLVLDQPDLIGAAGRSVRWIEIGSQAMSAEDKRAMKALFPNARILQHYGLTEASRSTFLDISQAPDEALDSVGRPSGGTQLRITPEGAIAIRGPHVALGRIEQGGVLVPVADADGWLVTRDRGEIRDGWLHYLGRLDDQINVAGVKIGAEDLEAAIRGLLPLAGNHVAAAPLPDPARGEVVLLAIEDARAEHAPLIEAAARLALERRGVALGKAGGTGALRVLRLPELPRTGTEKIRRRALPALWRERMAEEGPAPAPASTSLTESEAALGEVWARAVGAVPASPDFSFYDAGGDSLSSVRLGLMMESAGLPRRVIRATLEGHSLREAAALMSDRHVPAQAGLPDAARRSWAITMTRALMALSVLLSHWGPGLFERLGVSERAEMFLGPIYRAGTPGFAAVFGIGIGYFMLPAFAAQRASVLARMDAAFRLVLIGAVLLAAVRMAVAAVEHEPLDGLQLAHAFYSVLAYYAVMTGTARWWLPALARLKHPVRWLLGGLPILWLAWQGVMLLLPDEQLHSILELPRLMLGAGYSIFKLTAVASAGMAVGLWFANTRDTAVAAGRMMTAGAVGMALSALTLLEAYGLQAFQGRNSVVFTALPGLVFYLSAAVGGTGLFLHALMRWDQRRAWTRMLMRLLLVTGGLALPIYVFHEAVLPSRDLLVGLGLPNAAALGLTMGGFLVVMGLSGRRLWRMYAG